MAKIHIGPHWVAALAGVLVTAISVRAAAQNQATVGQWSQMQNWPNWTTHTHLMPTGKVMFWGEYDGGYTPYLWNPASGQLTSIPGLSYNPFCGGHAFLGDGRLFEAGGHVASHVGVPNASTYDGNANTWASMPDMNAGRWYPTVIPLSNGDVLVMSGEMAGAGDLDPLDEVYEVKTNSWRELAGAKLALPFFPRAFLAPDGKVFIAGTQAQSYWLDTTGSGTIAKGPVTNLGVERTYGGAVMYDIGKILLVGGGVIPTATAETIDLNAAAPAWKPTGSMSAARRQHNSTLLPDGTVLVTGGSKSGAAFNDPNGNVPYAELWNPATGAWTKLSAASQYRGYHSTGTLLPDGRVLTGGGRGPLYLSSEVFSPPYLFHGARPTIADAPTDIWPDAQFEVATPDAASIRKVSLIRLGSTTHSFNMNQRYVPLQFTAGGAGLIVTGPKDNNVAPTGHYMLFILNDQGVPSVAKILHVVYGPEAGPPPPLTSTPPPGGSPPPPVASKASKAKSGCAAAPGEALPLAGALGLVALLMRRRVAKMRALHDRSPS